MDNIILLTDSYKVSHYKQYPPGMQKEYSYFEARRGDILDYSIFFGLQYILKKYLAGIVVTSEKLWRARETLKKHFGQDLVNTNGWRHIIDKHQGRLPIIIKAVKEGTPVPTNNVLFTVENTDPEVPWLTSYLETLLVQCWYPTTVCTISNKIRRMLDYAAMMSGTPELVPFKLHDFGFRGVSSVESAGIGGLAHLVNFKGTDTLQALEAGKYYHAGVCGFSIPAAEHSTISAWGKDREIDAYENMLTQFPTGFVAVVSDTYNIYDACRDIWGTKLRDKVLERDGTLVVRPDSGDIVPTVLSVLEILGEKFGTYVNDKGYKVLTDKVRIIQGDGCTINTIETLIYSILGKDWSIDNIAFGMGGGLLQKCNRDTLSCAYKCSNATINGASDDIYKDPVGDRKKLSKSGRLALIKDDRSFKTIPEGNLGNNINLLVEVFNNGSVTEASGTFEDIRERALTNL